MKNLLEWIKANPLTVASIAIVVLSLGVIGWGMGQISAARTEAQTRVDDQSRQINRYANTSVQIPPERPDEDSETIRGVTVTEAAIRQLERLYGEINEQYDGVREFALNFNRDNHRRLVPALFTEGAGANVPYEARDEYRQAFRRLFGPPASDPTLPRLNAGMPPSRDRIEAHLSQLEDQFRMTFRSAGSTADSLSSEDEARLREEKREAYLTFLTDHAQRIHVYADAGMGNSGFPFQVGEWSRAEVRPEDHHLWEGQLELWIQQDIVRAIARANGVGEPNTSVLTAPVKRLLRVEVIPGYVGLHTLGGVVGAGDQRRVGSAGAGYPAPAGGRRTERAEGAVPVNFHVGHTGRISNAMYDVRHVRLRVIADDRQLPKLFQALSDVNFMTVLKTTVQNVDEYQALHEGFVYGPGSVVEAELIIETLWLREWTAELMPSRVRQYVGLDDGSDLQQDEPVW